MTTALIVLGVVVGMYGLAAVVALGAERRLHPQEAVPTNRRLAGRESDAVRRLMDGSLDRAVYHASMASIAAQDAAEYPLDVPKLRQ
ncbi:hypothetical protein OHA72_57125 [Dactylosporangium sp. NBC_01737]|uniref:hypothetical protein n=1 Tax=Dactylosporangium sp. NBC_01737 TaxID=2975959 RepID=UPI002E109E0F|nr:hypothetical protein OHA72_57125 [Dactylosporangium sp. NBC_01737]